MQSNKTLQLIHIFHSFVQTLFDKPSITLNHPLINTFDRLIAGNGDALNHFAAAQKYFFKSLL